MFKNHFWLFIRQLIADQDEEINPLTTAITVGNVWFLRCFY